MSRLTILGEISAERDLQESRWPMQDLPDGTSERFRAASDLTRERCDRRAADGSLTWRDLLNEEYGEAMAEEDASRLRAELLQTAAVAVRWIEAIDRRVA